MTCPSCSELHCAGCGGFIDEEAEGIAFDGVTYFSPAMRCSYGASDSESALALHKECASAWLERAFAELHNLGLQRSGECAEDICAELEDEQTS